jgi:hypothetical protein
VKKQTCRIAAGVAWVLLLLGSLGNGNGVEYTTTFICTYAKDGIFAGAAVLTLAATALGVTSYIMSRGKPVGTVAEVPAASSRAPQITKPDAGIAMDEPQLPRPQELSQLLGIILAWCACVCAFAFD